MTTSTSQPTPKRFTREAKALLLLATPLVISQLAQMGMTFTDTVMAGRHSEHSLAGVAIGASLWVPCFLFMVGILMAVTPMVAQAWGAEKYTDIKRSVQQAVWLAAVLGIFMMILLQLSGSLFDVIEMEEHARLQAKGYLFAVSFGLPPLALFQVLRALNEGAHFTRPFMLVSITAMLANIPLNYIFIYGELGLPELGGAGCGWATTLVLWLEVFLMLFITLKNKRLLHIKWHTDWKKPERQRILDILRLGVPIGIALLIESSMFSLIALFLAKLGNTAVAGHQVAMSFISTLFMVPMSLSMALTIRCGYFLGKDDTAQARFVAIMGIGFTLITASLFSLLILFFSAPIARLYTNDPDIIALAIELLFLAAIFQFSDAVQTAAAGVLRGYKDTRFTFIVVLIAYWGVGLPVGYILGLTPLWGAEMGAEGFWIGLIAGLGLASVLLGARVYYVSKRAITL